ncbi:hypothetical protein MCEMSE15_01607 [Fimbriimonadaceae bacterium]
MKSDLHKKLVDLYAGGELPKELNEELEMVAFNDAELSHDMSTLRQTVDLLKNDPGPEFTEESYQRVLMKIYARGGNIEPRAATPIHMQYQLPMQG